MATASTKQALGVGGIWASMAILFEFGCGHYVAGQTWSELLHDYDLKSGRLWALIPIGTALGPATVQAVRSPTRDSLAATLTDPDGPWMQGRLAPA